MSSKYVSLYEPHRSLGSINVIQKFWPPDVTRHLTGKPGLYLTWIVFVFATFVLRNVFKLRGNMTHGLCLISIGSWNRKLGCLWKLLSENYFIWGLSFATFHWHTSYRFCEWLLSLLDDFYGNSYFIEFIRSRMVEKLKGEHILLIDILFQPTQSDFVVGMWSVPKVQKAPRWHKKTTNVNVDSGCIIFMLSDHLCLFFPNVVGSESGFYSQHGYGYFCVLNFFQGNFGWIDEFG